MLFAAGRIRLQCSWELRWKSTSNIFVVNICNTKFVYAVILCFCIRVDNVLEKHTTSVQKRMKESTTWFLRCSFR